jgi:hypothetical protein
MSSVCDLKTSPHGAAGTPRDLRTGCAWMLSAIDRRELNDSSVPGGTISWTRQKFVLTASSGTPEPLDEATRTTS